MNRFTRKILSKIFGENLLWLFSETKLLFIDWFDKKRYCWKYKTKIIFENDQHVIFSDAFMICKGFRFSQQSLEYMKEAYEEAKLIADVHYLNITKEA
jgi:hypothetical protein